VDVANGDSAPAHVPLGPPAPSGTGNVGNRLVELLCRNRAVLKTGKQPRGRAVPALAREEG
jgi:hypothetical protein